MSDMSNSEFASIYNQQFQQLIDGAERHNPQTFNEESQRLLREFFARDVETEMISLSFLTPRNEAPHWNLNRLVIQDALYTATPREAPIYHSRAHRNESRVRPLVNLTMSPARDGNNLVVYWYQYDSAPNAVVLPDIKPARILTATRLV